MSALAKLKTLYREQTFNPGILGWLINPFYFIRSSIWNAVRADAPKLKGKLLDFGCGAKAYRKLFEVEEYIGLDVEQEGHSHETEDVDVFYDGKIIPFANNTFDSCFSSEVFEHVFELELSLHEINRVLKPGGQGLFVVPFVWDEHEVPYDYGRYSSFGLEYLLEKCGFEILQNRKDSHFVQVICQLWNLYLFNLGPSNKYLRLLYSLLVIAPSSLFGLFFSTLLPKKHSLYFNNVILVKKKG
ncbi:MAG: class I SAM-dependent methyltransferase [Bacteroidia bacterium]